MGIRISKFLGAGVSQCVGLLEWQHLPAVVRTKVPRTPLLLAPSRAMHREVAERSLDCSWGGGNLDGAEGRGLKS